MNQLNRKLAPEIESAYVMASPEYSFLSSTGVKELATFGGDVRDLVPAEVAEALARADRTVTPERPRLGRSLQADCRKSGGARVSRSYP